MSMTPKIPIRQSRATDQRQEGKGGYKNKRPSHTVFVPDFENPEKLTRVGVMFRFQSGKYKGTGLIAEPDLLHQIEYRRIDNH